MGLIVPVIRIRDNIQLKPNEYVIKMKGNMVARGELLLNHYLAMSPGFEDDSITGIETQEPAFGLPALWIEAWVGTDFVWRGNRMSIAADAPLA